ncbi:MAG: MASE3 domain-containing protein [Desulfotignum sp.]
MGLAVIGAAALFALFLLSGHNYLLFHTLVELWAVAVAWGLFLLIWNARRMNTPPGLMMLGLGYLLIGGMDLLHTLAYDGMGVFAETGADLATQMWIAARYIETAALILFPLSMSSVRLARNGMIGLTLAAVIMSVMILSWDLFPVCFDPDTGLTGFKTASEYIIMTLLTGAGVLTIHQRRKIGTRVAPLLAGAIFVTVVSEFMFTRYASPYGFSNMLGHLLKVLSFLLIYRALIVEGLEYPFETLARSLEKAREQSRTQQEFQTTLLEQVSDAVIATDLELRIVSWNAGAVQVYGYTVQEALGRLIDDLLQTDWLDTSLAEAQKLLARTGNWRGLVRQYHKTGRELVVEASVSWIHDSSGDRIGGVTANRDITDLRRDEEKRKKLHRELVKREQILGAVSEVAGHLLEQSVWDGVEKALQRIGESADVQRVYIFENHTGQDGQLLTSQRYEWSHDQVSSQKKNPLLLDIPYEEAGFTDWIDVLSKGRVIASPVSRLPEKQAEFLGDQQIQSLAVVPIFADRSWWGFMGFDDCLAPRQWHASELDALQAAARIFGAFVTRMQYLEALTTVSAREKHRLSRELHDGLCQDLKGLEIQAALLEDRLPQQDEPARQMAASLGKAANTAVKKAYAIVQGMFSVDLDITDFHSALAQLAEKLQHQTGISITTSLAPDLVPPSRLHAYHLYRIAQEALLNAIRHSGADKITLTWGRENRYMVLQIVDNGTGMDQNTWVSQKGMGVKVMTSRAQAISARLTIQEGTTPGTQLCVRLKDGQ